jgi:hypothetical protein
MFYCQLCTYKTNNRNKIHKHHIVPKELSGTNINSNLVFLCPSCHANIYIPNTTSGNHSIKSNNSIIINKWLQSTGGYVLEYIDNNGNVNYNIERNIQ